MALMFSRIAHNFAKNGYYPTDEKTLTGVLNALDTDADQICILDPCCGEGAALADVKHHLSQSGSQVQAYGVEYDQERAWHAKSILDMVAHASIDDMAIKPRQFGCLFLNPPYGDLVSDHAKLSDAVTGKKRLEKEFYKRSHPWLAFDGVLVLIVPYYVFDAEFSNLISKQYRQVKVFMAPEQQFKQCVLFGIKRKSDRPDPEVASQLLEMASGKLPPTLPENWVDELYQVPSTVTGPAFTASRMSLEEVEFELNRISQGTLWSELAQFTGAAILQPRAPLRSMSKWHLALALAAGQVSGVVRSKDGRTLLVKGDTYKDKSVVVSYEEADSKKGTVREVRVCTDKFVPVIRGIDFTPGRMYGHLVTIQ
jgi:hypothetical protein